MVTTRRLGLLIACSFVTGIAGGTGETAPAEVSDEPAGGVCIAPFHVEKNDARGRPPVPSGPNMSQTTWGPSAASHFEFFVDGRLRATVGNDEMAWVGELPTQRAIRVRVILDGAPFESFALRLDKEPDRRVCLHLDTGYWHWIDSGWSKAYGCTCGADGRPPAPGSPGGGHRASEPGRPGMTSVGPTGEREDER